MAPKGVNQPCPTLLAATDRDLLSLLDAQLVRVTDSPPSHGTQGALIRSDRHSTLAVTYALPQAASGRSGDGLRDRKRVRLSAFGGVVRAV